MAKSDAWSDSARLFNFKQINCILTFLSPICCCVQQSKPNFSDIRKAEDKGFSDFRIHLSPLVVCQIITYKLYL